MRNPRLVLTCLLIGLLSAGCSSKMLKIKGRIVKDGQPFAIPEGASMRIAFVPTESQSPDKYDSYFAVFDKTNSTFQVVGKDGNGLPPGKYKVGLELMNHRNDEFKGAYTANKSPWIFDVNSGTGEVVIDLGKKS
jgi:hypothetical protein